MSELSALNFAGAAASKLKGLDHISQSQATTLLWQGEAAEQGVEFLLDAWKVGSGNYYTDAYDPSSLAGVGLH